MQVVAILIAAASSPHGIVLRTSDPVACRAALYDTRKQLPDPELKDLQIRVSPDDSEGEVWIIKRKSVVTVQLAEAAQ